MEKGILTKEEEKWLAKVGDKSIKLKGFWEMVDGLLIRVLISLIDNLLLDKVVPEGWKNHLKEAVRLGKARDKKGLEELLDEQFDLPFFGKLEQVIYTSVVNFITAKIYAYVDSLDLTTEDVDD